MIKDIQPVQIWVAGETKTATKFGLSSVNDDLETFATLYYQLLDIDSQQLSQGNLTINGAEYQTWNDDPDANSWILNWAIAQLGLTLA